MQIQENIALAPYTVFKIGGPARYFTEAQNSDEIYQAIVWAKDFHVPIFILGAGSNVLVSDDGFPGLVVKMNILDTHTDGYTMTVGAGISMAQSVNFSVQSHLGGFEWGVGIPGTIGGSIFGNAGCFGGEMKDVVADVEVFNTNTLAVEHLDNAMCNFIYRHSVFKGRSELIILSATLRLLPGNADSSRVQIVEYTKKRISAQDIGSKCAGCIFKNASVDCPAGYLIDTAGLKGFMIGDAMVSRKHANYIINMGNATAHDIKKLISLIKEKVKDIHGIILEEEVRYL